MPGTTVFNSVFADYTSGDNVKVIFMCLMFLFATNLMTRVSTMYLLKHVGAITFVVMKLLKIPTIMVTEKFVFPRSNSLHYLSVLGALVVVAGVGIYSYYKITGKKK